jgi:nitrite reductase/ring-hydroxylating ferredoxin subunit
MRRSPIQRQPGVPATAPPHDPGCWTYFDGKVRTDLGRAPELAERSGALRLEGPALPERLLVLYGEDGRYHAYRNACPHGGHRLDPVPHTLTLACCSLGRSTFDYDGRALSGPAGGGLQPFPVRRSNGTLTIELMQPADGPARPDRTTADI